MKSQLQVTREGDPKLLLIESVILDCGLRCCVDVGRDIQYVQRRFKEEGDSFLYLRLPDIASLLEAMLGGHEVPRIPGLKLARGCLYPTFLSGFFRLVVEPDGAVKETACADAVFAIRQISRLYKKAKVPCTDSATEGAIDGYVLTDRELGGHRPNPASHLYQLYTYLAGILWTSSLTDLDHQVSAYALIPRHGSGATADRVRGNGKYQLQSWFRRLDSVMPFTSYLVPDLGADTRALVELSEDQPVVRVTTVPKTVAKPRIIATEPTAMQYAQQALMNGIYDAVQQTWLAGRIGFRDQQRNQTLARLGSEGRGFATLDLSEASDRVHPHYVGKLFGKLPNLRRAIFATRSPFADVPGHGIRRLRKFASMGSATCFPLQTMHFFTIVLASVAKQQSLLPEDFNKDLDAIKVIQALSKGVSVFGDDMVVPEPYAEQLVEDLEAFGLKVNRSKSFLKGRFRESCGGDYFDGDDVKPTYVRQDFPQSISDADAVTSWVATGNLLYEAGLWLSAEVVRRMIEDLVGECPLNSSARFGGTNEKEGCSAGLSWSSYQDLADWTPKKVRWCRDRHVHLVRTFVPKARMIEDPLSEHGALMKFFLFAERRSPFDPRCPSWVSDVLPQAGVTAKPKRDCWMYGFLIPGNQGNRKGHLDETPRPYSAKLRQAWVELRALS